MGIRVFTPVSPKVWHSKRFRSLSDPARLLFMYLLTGPNVTSIGCYKIPNGYICTDMKWDEATLRQHMDELVQSGMILEDQATEIIWIDKWGKFCRPTGAKSVKGAMKLLNALPEGIARNACSVALFGEVDVDGSQRWLDAWRDKSDATPPEQEQSQIPPRLNTGYLRS